MKFLGDMGVAGKTIDWLRDLGHDAVHLRDEGLQRMKDGEILEKAKAKDRILLTMDLGFGARVAASGQAGPSVIIFRLEDERPANVNRRLTTYS